MNTCLTCILTFAASVAVAGAQAQSSTAATDAGDPAAGQQLSKAGVPAKAVLACVTCHGQNGEGNDAGGFPRLAGLPAAYLVHQLDAYADGSRKNPIMEPIAKGMTPEQRRDVAAYFHGLSSTGAAATASPPAAAAPQGQHSPPAGSSESRGSILAKVGDEGKQVQACVNCHGPGGIGSPPDIPYLAGQHPSYLAAALRAFADGSRSTDPSRQMSTIAHRLSADDIAAVVAYFAALPPPRSDAEQARRLAEIRDQAARGSASATPATASKGQGTPQGVGTEQGAPLTGGAQGPGGGGGGSGSGPSGGNGSTGGDSNRR